MNPYLKRLRDQYAALTTSIQGLQTRAATDNRDLTEDELRSVTEQSEQGKTLFAQITLLTEEETRSAQVADLAAKIAGGTDGGAPGTDQNRAVPLGGATTKDRDPGHYRSAKEGGENSFFGDIYHARVNQDEAAGRRLAEHNRALSTGSQGPGVVPPKWMTEEFETIARQGRRLAAVVRRIPLGDDPRPITLPKQITGTDGVVSEQAAENDPVAGADAYDTDVDVVTPKPTSGKQTVSRQMLDMSSPAIDQLIYGDLLEVYDDKVEAKIGAALLVAAGASVSSAANEAAFNLATGATFGADLAIDAAIAVRNARKRPADILAMSVNRYGKFLKLKDTTGRPMIPGETAGLMNVAGVGTVAVDGRIEGLGVVATDGLPSAYAEKFLALRAMDQVLFESNVLRFRYEEVAGPESVVLGIWGYTAFISRQATKSVKASQVTAA